MDKCTFANRCIVETIDGLRDGLTHFSGPSRTAVIYSIKPDDPIQIYDPLSLLTGHEPKFKELYIDTDEWRKKTAISYDKKKFSNLIPEKNLGLAGLISYGGRSSSVVYQMWFTEHHPDMCAIGPTERWLEQAVWRFSHDIANEEELYTGISGSFLREYSTHAVRDYLVDEMNVLIGWDTRIRIYPILEAILKISRTPEEGAWPKGELIFVEKRSLPIMKFIAKIPKAEQPILDNVEHIRKLLQSVENSDRKLVVDEKTIIGIIKGDKPDFSITADFKGRHGFLKLNNNTICSFSDGSFKSTTHKAKLVQVEEALLESNMDPVDGALHLGADLKLHGFACLLDGHFIPGEDRARGARFNSALRFTAERDNIIVIVVSSDDPVSIMIDGVALNTKWQSSLFCNEPVLLEKWVTSSKPV